MARLGSPSPRAGGPTSWAVKGPAFSDLPRKSHALSREGIEPIASSASVPPRTLQRFLESVERDEVRLRDQQQGVVARDHADREAIGLIDETEQVH